jgi:hypothetical protein
MEPHVHVIIVVNGSLQWGVTPYHHHHYHHYQSLIVVMVA